MCIRDSIWSAVRNGGSLSGMTVTVAILAFACEFAQRYLPGRTAEITSALLALGMGWLISALGSIQRFRRGHPDI